MRLPLLLTILAACLLLLAVLSLSIGPGDVPLSALFEPRSASDSTILFDLRLPRTIMAVLAGTALAVSGVLMQTYFRNPLAEPYITGVSAGGALGAVAGAALGVAGAVATGFAALLGSALVALALYLFALRQGRSATSLLLIGLAIGTFCGALVWLLLLRMGPGGTDSAIAWLLGRVSTVRYDEILPLGLACLLGLGLAISQLRQLDVLLLGPEKAASLGIDTANTHRLIVGSATLLASVCVAFCGVIAFVGLMVPHLMRQLVGSVHARLLPAAALGGAVLLLGIDILSRVLDPPREIPITVLTSLVGAPFFIYVLSRKSEALV